MIISIEPSFFENWFEEHGRDFPWRAKTVKPFSLLLTEMLLRQTNAERVASIWHNLAKKYSCAKDVVDTQFDELYDDIRTLGFGRIRAHALKQASKWLIEKHNGVVPVSEQELMRIPHVGVYIANALLCFAFNQSRAIVDVNVLRFVGRYKDKKVPKDLRNAREVWDVTSQIVERSSDAKSHNYGLLDFTAQICKARNPNCEICPLSEGCSYYEYHSGIKNTEQ